MHFGDCWSRRIWNRYEIIYEVCCIWGLCWSGGFHRRALALLLTLWLAAFVFCITMSISPLVSPSDTARLCNPRNIKFECAPCNIAATVYDTIAFLTAAFFVIKFNLEEASCKSMVKNFFGLSRFFPFPEMVLRGLQIYYTCVHLIVWANDLFHWVISISIAICMSILSVGIAKAPGLSPQISFPTTVICMVLINAIACRFFRDLYFKA